MHEQRYSATALEAACLAQRAADHLADLRWWQGHKSGRMAVLPRWTAWLLMEKAGMPRTLIAFLSYVDEQHVSRRLLVVKALMVWPPYAARIEALAQQIPRFDAPHAPTTQPARGAACAVRAR